MRHDGMTTTSRWRHRTGAVAAHISPLTREPTTYGLTTPTWGMEASETQARPYVERLPGCDQPTVSLEEADFFRTNGFLVKRSMASRAAPAAAAYCSAVPAQNEGSALHGVLRKIVAAKSRK